ncbi:MAG TPA: hypothetical protein DCF49_07080 [Lachnospiraceae bacterium]|nr:hypothetical protein [Lachnospiraceae bacterium]
MADELHLNEDEAVIDRIGKVGYGGFWSGNNDLVLTNKNIILVKKGLFGEVQETVKFPLSDLRVVNGEVQARIGHPDNVTHTLDLYFNKGTESFRFEWESDVQKWIDKITEVITGVKVERDEFAWVSETLAMAESVNKTINSFKKTLGIKSTEQVSIKCPSCGATLTGISGDTVKCPYCGTFTTL